MAWFQNSNSVHDSGIYFILKIASVWVMYNWYTVSMYFESAYGIYEKPPLALLQFTENDSNIV